MMSVKLATLDLLKIKILWNKGYNITISVHNITSKSLSCDSNYIVNMVLWPKIGNSSISHRELLWFDKKNNKFLGGSWFNFNNLGLALGIGLKFCTSKWVKTKRQKGLGANSYVCRSYHIKTGRGNFLLSPTMIWVTVTMLRESLFWFAWKTTFT